MWANLPHTEVQGNMYNLTLYILCCSMLPSAGQQLKADLTDNSWHEASSQSQFERISLLVEDARVITIGILHEDRHNAVIKLSHFDSGVLRYKQFRLTFWISPNDRQSVPAELLFQLQSSFST